MYPLSGTIECGKSRRWMILNVDDEVHRYYRFLYHMENFRLDKIQRVKQAHVTIIRDETVPNKHLWWNYHGEKVTVGYIPGAVCKLLELSHRRPIMYYWLNVVSERLEQIREELGLPRNSDGIYHTTLGTVLASYQRLCV